MPSLNEYQETTLLSLTSQTSGALPELESRWLKAATGMNAHVNEMWPVFLASKGFTTGALNERQLAYWYSVGAPAKSTWNEAYRWFLENGGPGPVQAIILLTADPIVTSRFFYGGSLAAYLTFTNTLSLFGNATSFSWTVAEQNVNSVIVPAISQVYAVGDFVFKYDVVSTVSGTPATMIYMGGLTGQAGLWKDLYTVNEIYIRDTIADATVQHFTINMTIARNNGSGGPVPGSEVVKPIECIVYLGTAADYLMQDSFAGTAGTNLTAHAMDNGGKTWVAHAGTIQLEGTSAAIAGAVGDNRYVADCANANVCLVMDIRTLSGDCGLIARAVDANNYWLLKITGGSTANPLLELIEVVAGVPTVRDSYTFTGLGPFNLNSDSVMRIMCDGNDIYGDFFYARNLTVPPASQLQVNSASFNTATRFGMYLPNPTPRVDNILVTTKEIGLLT